MTLLHVSRRAAASLLFVAGIAIVTTACGGNDNATASKQPPPPPPSRPPAPRAPAPSIDACSLLTRSEAEAALRKPVKDPARSDVAPVFSCRFAAAEGFDTVSLTVTIYDDARQANDAYVMALKINNYKEVAGLGDRAYESPISDITVLAGRYELSVDVSMSAIEKDAEVKKAKDLATRALARLSR